MTSSYQPALLALSLDAPVAMGSDTTLLDLLAYMEAADDYAALYDAYLDGLPGEEVAE